MAFRAFYALPVDNFATSTGQHTNAVHGFTSMLLKLIAEEKPTHVAVAFDVGSETFRTREYSDYKGTRDKAPEEFPSQIPLIKEVLDALRIRHLEAPDFEADDIVATLKTSAEHSGFDDVLICSGDRDTLQLVTDTTTVLYPTKGVSVLTRFTPGAVEEKYGVPPARYPELAALVGETSDNLPGVPGVGPKTAAKWIGQYDGLDNVIARADEIGGKAGQSFRDNLENVLRNRKLNHLLTDMDLGVAFDELIVEPVDREAVHTVFDALEFNTLRDRVFATLDADASASASDKPDLSFDIASWSDDGDLAAFLQAHAEGENAQRIALVLSEGATDVDRLALATRSHALVLDLSALPEGEDAVLSAFLSGPAPKIAHDAKQLWHRLRALGYELDSVVFDTDIAAYLIHPDQRRHSLIDLAQRYLDRDVAASDAASGQLAFELDSDAAIDTLAQQALAIAELEVQLTGELEDRALSHLMTKLELPVQRILQDMESTGIAVSATVFNELFDELDADVKQAADDAYAAIGEEINLSSPKQLQRVLFEDLQMPKTKRTKTGWTTDAEALSDLFDKTGHPFLAALLAHRDRIKLRQIVETLRSATADDGRIHTTFQQTVAATGRLSSTDPNLQNIPARSEAGLRIREAFVVGEGFETLMTVDYSQIEMRIMAHLSGDAGLIEAFRKGEDLHNFVGARVFDVSIDEVTPQMRSRVKAMSYGLAYGLSSFGLSRQLGIEVGEAKSLMDEYFDRFGGVRDYLRTVVEQARRTGFTETMFGRRRYLPDLTSDNRQRREMAERAALNAPIQGSAADIIKVAMISIDDALTQAGLASRMLLQVHDELVLEIAPGELDQVEKLVREHMAGAAKLDVPLDVSVGVGESWRAAGH